MSVASLGTATASAPPGLSLPLKKRLFFNYEGYGWLEGTVVRRNGDRRRTMDDGTIANFIAKFDMDEGRSTALLLESDDYSTRLLAPTGSWFLLAEEEEEEEEEAEVEAEAEAGGEAEEEEAEDEVVEQEAEEEAYEEEEAAEDEAEEEEGGGRGGRGG